MDKAAHTSTDVFAATAVNCQTKRHATGRKSSGLLAIASRRILAQRNNAVFNRCRYPLRWLLNVGLPRIRRGSRKSGTCQGSCD